MSLTEWGILCFLYLCSCPKGIYKKIILESKCSDEESESNTWPVITSKVRKIKSKSLVKILIPMRTRRNTPAAVTRLPSISEGGSWGTLLKKNPEKMTQRGWKTA